MKILVCYGIFWLSVLCPASGQVQGQEQSRTLVDPFEMRVAGVQLRDQSIVDGVASLSQSTDIAFSIEFPLGTTIAAAAPAVKVVTATVPSGTVREVLDRLCGLDSSFTWVRFRNAANLLPRSVADDPTYVLNRKIDLLVLDGVPSAQAAVVEMVGQLPGPREQIAIMQSGAALNFARPWTVQFKNITVREFLDEIAREFGPTYGWQFGGAADFRVMTFHERLAAKGMREGQKSEN